MQFKPRLTSSTGATLIPQMSAMMGPAVAEGTYTVRLTKGKRTYEGAITIVGDPRASYTPEDKVIQDKTVMKLYDMLERLTFLADTLLDVQKQAEARAGQPAAVGDAATALTKLGDDLEAFRKTVVATHKGGFIAGEEQLREKLGWLYGSVNGFEGKPTGSQLEYATALEQRLSKVEARFEAILTPRLDKLNAQLRPMKLDPIERRTREEWEAKQ